MFSQLPRKRRGPLLFLAAMAIGLVAALLQVVPVTSQAVTLRALRVDRPISQSDPWAAIWDDAAAQQVPLSAQNIAPPFGGGTVSTLTVRALHDGDSMYLLLEWADDDVNDAVNSVEQFTDAAAVQFPGVQGAPTPLFMMGSAGSPVNIWQWRAVWQADIDRGFATSATRYPNTYSDGYPNADDPLYRTALAAGNPIAQRDHESPVENLIAEGFGTLTHADGQDVDGAGAWQDGRWRALFVRDMEPAAAGLASFAEDETTNIAFAVWDGSEDDRNGQKSIAPWINLEVSSAAAGDGGGGSSGRVVAFVIVVLILGALAGAYVYEVRRQRAAA